MSSIPKPKFTKVNGQIIVNWLDWEAYIFARAGSNPALTTIARVVKLVYTTGLSPVATACEFESRSEYNE